MTSTRCTRLLLAICLAASAAAAAAPQGQGEMVRGGQSIMLTGPITDDVATRVKAQAFESFREEVLGWLEVNLLAEWSKGNGIDRVHLNTLARECAQRAAQDSRFQGKKWVFTYEFPAATLAKKANEWNQRHDALAVRYYVQFNAAREERNIRDTYVFGLRTIFHARAHLGERPNTPGKSGRDFLFETTQGLRELLEKLSISSPDAVLTGKPGFPPDNDITVTGRIGTEPFPSYMVSAILPGGRRGPTVCANESGVASFKRVLMPYVANGAFFTVAVNPGAEIDTSCSFTLSDLGLGLARSNDLTLMFKITRPTFALNYKANAVSDIVVPRDFGQAEVMTKFLRDSCFLEPAPAGATSPDLAIGIICQVSSYVQDASESQVYRTEMLVTVDERNSPRHSGSQRSEMYEKITKAGLDASTGQYFWEATRMLGSTVKAALGGL